MEKTILYIGNKLNSSTTNPTTHSTLEEGLRAEGYTIISASPLKNKILRLSHMLLVFFLNNRKADNVLIDVYSTQNFWYAVIMGKLAALFQKKYIPILHGGDLKKRFGTSPKASESFLKRAYAIVSPSAYLKNEVEKMGISSVVHIPNPIFILEYNFKSRKIIHPNLLWVRAFDRIYNPLLALKTLEILQKKYPDSKLCMVGPDKDGCLESCRIYSAEKNLNVIFTGKLKKKQWTDLASDYDIFINTSDIDNTPVSVIEAMALGLPVVSTEVGGIPYLLKDGKYGYIVPPDDAQAMADSIEGFIKEPSQATATSIDARLMTESLDWGVVKQKWIKLLS